MEVEVKFVFTDGTKMEFPVTLIAGEDHAEQLMCMGIDLAQMYHKELDHYEVK